MLFIFHKLNFIIKEEYLKLELRYGKMWVYELFAMP